MPRVAASCALAAILMIIAAPAFAQQHAATGLVAPTEAVAEAWAREAREAQEAEALRPSSKALKGLYGSYGVLQGLDLYSTVLARRNGAREVNPMMSVGYAKATALKAVMTATTLMCAKSLEKKNKKAAVVTMIVLNAVTVAVATNNLSNARRLK